MLVHNVLTANNEGLVSDASRRIETWIDRAEGVMDFAAKAQERFREATLETKSRILACLGTNFNLREGKLEVSVDNGLVFLQKAAPRSRNSGYIEPLSVKSFQDDSRKVCVEGGKWGG